MQTISGTINSASNAMDPSVYVDPRSRNMFSGMTPFVSQSNIASALGDVLPMESSIPFQSVNYHIAYTHTLVPWTDNSHMYISPGALLFGDRHAEKENTLYSADATIATVNDILRTGFERFQEMRRMPNSGAERFAAAVLDDSKMLQKIDMYRFMARKGYNGNGDLEVKRNAQDIDKYEYRYMTKQGILGQFNFLGIVQSRGDSIDERGREYKEGQVANISFVPRGRIEVANIWGGANEVTHGSMLYLVLHQRKNGMFQIRPRVTRDERLIMKKGDVHYWYVGSVAYRADSTPSQQFVINAISHKDPASADKALATLPRITIDVRI